MAATASSMVPDVQTAIPEVHLEAYEDKHQLKQGCGNEFRKETRQPRVRVQGLTTNFPLSNILVRVFACPSSELAASFPLRLAFELADDVQAEYCVILDHGKWNVNVANVAKDFMLTAHVYDPNYQLLCFASICISVFRKQRKKRSLAGGRCKKQSAAKRRHCHIPEPEEEEKLSWPTGPRKEEGEEMEMCGQTDQPPQSSGLSPEQHQDSTESLYDYLDAAFLAELSRSPVEANEEEEKEKEKEKETEMERKHERVSADSEREQTQSAIDVPTPDSTQNDDPHDASESAVLLNETGWTYESVGMKEFDHDPAKWFE